MTAGGGAAMPGPQRVARRSVAMLIRMGATRREAASTVIQVCDSAVIVIRSANPDCDLQWLADVCLEARRIRDISRRDSGS